MPHVYPEVKNLESKEKLGDGNCVALVQALTKVGHTSAWRPGERVLDAMAIAPGTVIATFENGRYPNRPTTGLVPAGIPLTGGGMYTGPLAQRGELRGSERRITGGFITHFGFDRDQQPPGKWFVCYYGHVQLARRVADATTECELTHKDRKFPDQPSVQLSCRN